jgi:hypothetical protein
MFKEITAHLPLGKDYDNIIGFNVDLDVDSEEAIDVYAYETDYEDLPAPLKKLTWKTQQNALFIHADNPGKAWNYLKKHAIYNLDEE